MAPTPAHRRRPARTYFNAPVPRSGVIATGVGVALFAGVFAWRAEHEVAPVQASAHPPQSGRVIELESRFASTDVLEVWGAADVPDGTTVRLRLRTQGAPGAALASVPVRGGHFVVTATVPERLRGRSVAVVARLAG